ncbi:MAG: hypothetical protein ACPGUD_12395 [Parashewanella sp.]
MIGIKPIISLALAGSISYLAYSLIQVADEVKQVRKALPNILTQVQDIESKIKVEQWLALTHEVKQQVPDILTEVSNVRKVIDDVNANIPNILTEVNSIRVQMVPSILTEVKIAQKETLPNILSEIKTVRADVIPIVLNEVEQVRNSVPPVLFEVAKVREMTPKTIKHVSALISQAESASNKISKQVTSGAIEGVVASPWELLKSVGKEAVNKADELEKND